MNPFNTTTLKQTALIGILASQLMSVSAHADELSPLVVTAGRIAENPANVSADTTVISRDDIEASQANTIADILRTQVGIDVVASGGLGKTTSVFLRGGNDGHTLVLIDGVRVGAVTDGKFDWANLSTIGIERIEIVRGAQSSLYGADAMGGVIQIFTLQGKKGIHIQASAESGTYGTKSTGVSVQGGTESGITYALSAETLSTDGFSVAAKGTEADPYDRTTLSGRVAFQAGNADVELSLRNVTGTTDLDGFPIWGSPVADILNYTQETKQNVSSFKVLYPFSDTFETTVQLSRSVDDAAAKGPSSWDNYYLKTTTDQLTLQNHLDLDTASILFGLDMFTSKGATDKYEESMTQKALFSSFSQALDDSNINASVRYDDNSAYGNQTTYKLGTVYHISKGFNVSANYATGFKTPEFLDLYYPGFNNPDLRPETSKGWDIGFNYQAQDGDLSYDVSVVYFNQKYKDLIVYSPAARKPDNVDSATSKGTELTASVKHTLGFIRANWTTLDATDDTTGDWLARRAQDSGSITLGTDVSGLHAEVQYSIVGKRFDKPDNLTKLDAYNKTDLRMSYTVNKTWKAKFRVENLQDRVYEEVSGYAVAGRATYAGVNATF